MEKGIGDAIVSRRLQRSQKVVGVERTTGGRDGPALLLLPLLRCGANGESVQPLRWARSSVLFLLVVLSLGVVTPSEQSTEALTVNVRAAASHRTAPQPLREAPQRRISRPSDASSNRCAANSPPSRPRLLGIKKGAGAADPCGWLRLIAVLKNRAELLLREAGAAGSRGGGGGNNTTSASCGGRGALKICEKAAAV